MLTYYLLFQDGPLPKNVFDPLAQHREWCPWISVGKENVDPGAIPFSEKGSGLYQQGWKAALDLLMPMKKNSSIDEGSPAQARQKVQIFIFHKKESSDMYMIDLYRFTDFCFVCLFVFSSRAPVTNLKGCLLYSDSGRFPLRHLSRLFANKNSIATLKWWTDLHSCLWYRIHITNDRSVKCY